MENDLAVKRPVTIGRSQGLLLEITSGLNPGDMLISEGSQIVQEGSKVYAAQPVAGTVRVE
jgi:multidrug efflux pump subunit AcrA (membrane-fusion protein)